jgi:hypothetical protein
LVPLSLLTVIATSLYISVIASIRYRFSVIMYLLFTSLTLRVKNKREI